MFVNKRNYTMTLLKLAFVVCLFVSQTTASHLFTSKSFLVERRGGNPSTHYGIKTNNIRKCASENKSTFVAQFPRGGDTTANVASAVTKTDIVAKTLEWMTANPARCWVTLLVAITVEILATTLMKAASDYDNELYLFGALGLYVIFMFLLGLALKQIEMGVAYAVWSGLGTAVATAIGMFFFNENKNFAKIICVSMVLMGCVGLNLVDGN